MAEMKERVLVKEYEEDGIKAVVDHRTGIVKFCSDDEHEFSCKLEDVNRFSSMMLTIYLREGFKCE